MKIGFYNTKKADKFFSDNKKYFF